jgi:hypothetical protein
MFEKARKFIAQRRSALAARKTINRGVPRGFPASIFGGRVVGMTDYGPIVKGRVVIETQACDATGKPIGDWKVHEEDPNLVVTQAETIMAQMSIGASNSALSYIELGDPPFPANPPQLSDISLQATTGQRMAVSLTAVGNVVTAQATWLTTQGNGFTYTEAGLFNGLLGSGLMFARKAFSAITKNASFQLRFTWYITFLVNTQGGDCSGIALIGPATVVAFTVYNAVGNENSIAATFDFPVGGNLVDFFLNGVRQVPGVQYTEGGAPLNAPTGGPPLNKGVNLIGFSLNPGDQVFLVSRSLG